MNSKLRKWSGKNWIYYTEYSCDFCSTKINTCKANINTTKRKHTFCCTTCKQQFYLKQNDIKQFLIMDKQNDKNFYYLLGLIASDGYIKTPGTPKSSKNYSCTIELHESDKKLLENIQYIFGGSIHYRKRKKSYVWLICNSIFINFIVSIGITNKKSLTLDVAPWFNNLQENYQLSFIRGVFDGDGSICFIKNTNTWFGNICSCSKDFIELLYEYFKNKEYNVKKGKNDIHFNGKYILKPFEYIFNNTSDIFLERKKEKYDNMRNFYKCQE